MRERRRRDVTDDGGAVRDLLRHWTVPDAPAAMERRLRATFRERAAVRRRGMGRAAAGGLAAAAALVCAAAALVIGSRRPMPPRGTPAAGARGVMEVHVAPPLPERPQRAAHARASGRAPARRPAVVVESDQRALLVALGREWRDARLAPPAPALPRVEAVAADAADRWEPLGDGWQRALPVDGGYK